MMADGSNSNCLHLGHSPPKFMGAAISSERIKGRPQASEHGETGGGGASSSLMDQMQWKHRCDGHKIGWEEMGSTFEFSKFAGYFYIQTAF
jgi:hypothetical protein